MTRPPYSSTARRVTGEALRGMTNGRHPQPRRQSQRLSVIARTVRDHAASGARSSGSFATALQAPRNLNAPPF